MLKGEVEKKDSLEKPTLSSYAYDAISQALLSGRLKPGEKLTLRQLMAMLDTSSTPIRDAIRQLSVENAIDFVPNRHIRVPKLRSEQLIELRDIRIMLEGSMTEIAARHMTPEVIENLRAMDAEIRTNRDAGDIVKAMDGIYHFHFIIYDVARRDHQLSLIRGLWLRTAPYRSLLFPNYSNKERGNLRRLIMDALEQRDGSSARMFMQADTTGAMNHIIDEVRRTELKPQTKLPS